tara:strand:- start:192 stop:1358 length:1167 start_codon:yes stop_codon:yes gene_type:complete
MNNKKVIVLGGDGFCGWPTSLHLSDYGYEVIIVDNLSRRNIDNELSVTSLTPIASIDKRLSTWNDISRHQIRFINLDVSKDYDEFLALVKNFAPDSIVHFAEQRAAPYSMKSSKTKRYTIDNNINSTHNVCCAIVESGIDLHLVHLGTMGVYGYSSSGMKIPEGYLDVEINHDGNITKKEILYPTDPGSIYHLTKTHDQLTFHYYNKNDGIRITDLHQGVVWGTQTKQTIKDDRLINRFDYDGDYGTVLNRFLMQAAIGHPLTVYGTGGQTRAFINIQDTVHCIKSAIEHPPERSDRVKIINQMTETHQVNELAKTVSKLTGVDIVYLDNPRNEAQENDLFVDNKVILDRGLHPILLGNNLITEIHDIALKYKDNCDVSRIECKSLWK